jgi:hypothetical protein
MEAVEEEADWDWTAAVGEEADWDWTEAFQVAAFRAEGILGVACQVAFLEAAFLEAAFLEAAFLEAAFPVAAHLADWSRPSAAVEDGPYLNPIISCE